jgi:2-haloacid dehalogenase
MKVTLAFDVYGTLIDTNGIVLQLQGLIGNKEKEFSQTWRDKQLEYSFRRGLMQNYEKFAVCTSHALDYTCEYYKISLSREQKKNLLEHYRTLPAFEDAKAGLATLKASNFRMFAFSNGSAEAVESLLVSAGIRDYFLGIVSVDDIKSFKPNPAVYNYFLRKSDASCSNAWLISSNSFDVIGAISAGMRTAWVRRSQEAIFDPWGVDPTLIVENLSQLNDKITGYHE